MSDPASTRRAALLGARSAGALAALGVLYVAAFLSWFLSTPDRMRPISDPHLAWMEIVTLASAPFMVLVAVALARLATPERRGLARAMLFFMVSAAALTTGVHGTGLALARLHGADASRWFTWPAPAYFLDVVAWDPLLGAALVFAVGLVPGRGVAATAARVLVGLAGALCLVGTAGPVTGDMRLQRIGVAGYGLVLPFAYAFLAAVLARAARASKDA